VSAFDLDLSLQVDSGSAVDAASADKEPCEDSPHREPRPRPGRLPFRNLTLVQAVKVLLREQKQLHGKEIERLLREGGYRTKARHFQQGMFSAFERDGGFVNVGGNTWKLKMEPSANGTLPETRQGITAV
jgi:hypothetical protein